MLIFHNASHPTHTHYVQCVTFGFFPSVNHEIAYNMFVITMLYLAPLLIIIISYGVMVVTIVKKSRLSFEGEYQCLIYLNVQFSLKIFLYMHPSNLIFIMTSYHISKYVQSEVAARRILSPINTAPKTKQCKTFIVLQIHDTEMQPSFISNQAAKMNRAKKTKMNDRKN